MRKSMFIASLLCLTLLNASNMLVLKNTTPLLINKGGYFILPKEEIDNKKINGCIIYDNNKTANIICSIKDQVMAGVAIAPILHNKENNITFLENFIELKPLNLK